MSIDHDPPAGLSVMERELFDHLVRHLDEENQLIEDYEKLAAEAGGHVAYLLRLIIEDEHRHHRLFEEWCNTLRSDAEFRPVEPQVPHLGSAVEPGRGEGRRSTASSPSSGPTGRTWRGFASRSGTSAT